MLLCSHPHTKLKVLCQHSFHCQEQLRSYQSRTRVAVTSVGAGWHWLRCCPLLLSRSLPRCFPTAVPGVSAQLTGHGGRCCSPRGSGNARALGLPAAFPGPAPCPFPAAPAGPGAAGAASAGLNVPPCASRGGSFAPLCVLSAGHGAPRPQDRSVRSRWGRGDEIPQLPRTRSAS